VEEHESDEDSYFESEDEEVMKQKAIEMVENEILEEEVEEREGEEMK